jgi:HD-GYP domain-containing protein (c-di-GMP phosphodiesterase class II)
MSERDKVAATKGGERRPGSPILTHDRSLESKIAKGSEAWDVLDQQVMQLGVQLVMNLHILFKTAKLHDRTNTALDQPIQGILSIVETLAHDGSVVLRLQNDFLFLDVMHLKMQPSQFLTFMQFIESLNERQLGAIVFSSTVKAAELREFAYVFSNADLSTASAATFKEQLRAHNIGGIDVQESRRIRIKMGQKNEQAKLLMKNNYVKAAEAVGEIVESVKEGRVPYFRRAKRVVQGIVDLMLEDESLAVSLTNLRCYDQYTHNHSVNVSILSISLGRRIGFPKAELADLGVAALFHDMGKASVPQEVLNKSEELTTEEWDEMYRHPTEGVLNLLQLRGIDHLPSRMAAAAFEHHMNYDFSGYPKLSVPWKLSLTGRILQIADCYDAMTSSRVYRRTAMAPEKVLRSMLVKSGTSFDPVLLKLFIDCVGILPIGTLVLLDTGELAIVMRPARDRKLVDRPGVKIITDRQGHPADGPDAELTETDFEGAFRRSIVRVVDNVEYRFDTSRYLV